ncbi:hypothetical protein K466DRAFT_57317 [Polyporus arcularius HHB13444]|uniref:Uncharacterized protein n=1 Tax=Polyporus arcularius HHB13444 TaxID=1314778 RepID=A0A5C3NNE9_9APHY|nr:hypothetical protein K466DRAFT_57317 [Polyporus arcularius HHB13444]
MFVSLTSELKYLMSTHFDRSARLEETSTSLQLFAKTMTFQLRLREHANDAIKSRKYLPERMSHLRTFHALETSMDHPCGLPGAHLLLTKLEGVHRCTRS